MAMLSLPAQAQILGYDFLTLEAYASAHRVVGAEMVARASIEAINKNYHDAAASTLFEYKEINVKLDKWKGFFDAVDLGVNSLQTVGTIYATVCDVKEDGEAIYSMLSTFVDQCTLKGDIRRSDLEFVDDQKESVNTIKKEAEDFWLSCVELGMYLSGTSECKTETLISILKNMNEQLDAIRHEIRALRNRIYEYTYLRTHYWKAKLFEKHRASAFGSSCFDRWLTVAKGVR